MPSLKLSTSTLEEKSLAAFCGLRYTEFRRKGIAAKLIKNVTNQLKQEGAEAVFASTQRRNFAALLVLTRQGFKRIGFLCPGRLFGWHIFQFYSAIWFAPGEVVLIHN